MSIKKQFSVTVVLFEDFELLDACCPVGLMSRFPELGITMVGAHVGGVRSYRGVSVAATRAYDDVIESDIILVPGGRGARRIVHDKVFLSRLRRWGEGASVIASVCTGAAILASAGLLDGCRATSNKRAFSWVKQFGYDVTWVSRARWVHDGNRWTSSGVMAGLDMTVALLVELYGQDRVKKVVDEIEYLPCNDADDDPFSSVPIV